MAGATRNDTRTGPVRRVKLADGKLDRKKQSALYVRIGRDGSLASEPPTSLEAFNEEMARAKMLIECAGDANRNCIVAFREYELLTELFKAMFADLRPGAIVEEERFESPFPGVEFVKRTITVANVVREDAACRRRTDQWQSEKMFDDDFLRRLREQEEMIRRLTEGPLRYLRENETAIERAQELVRSLDTNALAVQALESERALSRAAEFAGLTNAALARLALPESITAMERYLSQHREMQEAAERLALPHKTINEYVYSMSATMESANLAAASLDWSRIGGLWSAAERERDLLARFTDRLSLRHADLIASLETSEGLLASAPTFVSELPTLGVFVHTGAVRSITPHEPLEADEEERSLSLRVDIHAASR